MVKLVIIVPLIEVERIFVIERLYKCGLPGNIIKIILQELVSKIFISYDKFFNLLTLRNY